MKDKKNENDDDSFENFIDTGYCLKNRIICINEISETDMNKWIRVMKLLEVMSDDPITIYINSPGGLVYDGLGLYDLIRDSNCWIHTVAISKVMSMGVMLFLAGDSREAKKSTTFMCHEVSSGTFGTHSQMANDVAEVKRLNERLIEILADRTKKGKKFWREYIKGNDQFITVKEARSHGII